MNDETKESKPNDFVTDDQRFYMKREGGQYSYSRDDAGIGERARKDRRQNLFPACASI